MKKNLILCLLALFGCVDQEVKPEETVLEVAPVWHLSFDHIPTKEEINAALVNKYGNKYSTNAKLNDESPFDPPTYPAPNHPYEKSVTLGIQTKDVQNAGTDHAGNCRFIGKWLDNNNVIQTVSFILDNDDIDDLERGAIDVFGYFFTVTYDSDQLISGQLKNTASDRWLCDFVSMSESACEALTEERLEVLFSWGNTTTDWIDSNGNVFSSVKTTSVTETIDYTTCD